MNTDNMSILGLTIDYGPYGWLEGFDLSWTPNTTDAQGRRYCYGQQPQIAHWNLTRLASALYDLIGDEEALRAGLESYRGSFEAHWAAMLANKLGIRLDTATNAEPDTLLSDLFTLLQETETDMTIFFRQLADVPTDADARAAARLAPLREAFYDGSALDAQHGRALAAWLNRYAERVSADGEPSNARRARMQAANPKYVLRNWIAQLAIDDAAQGDSAKIKRLLRVLEHPYDEQPEAADLFARRPEWARHRAGCSALSCSS
jgi:uncharacterized protein YdiU (UPF0061 family)